MQNNIIKEEAHHYKILKLPIFRETEGVVFDILPMDNLPNIDGIDRVIHRSNAVSPGPTNGVDNPWYMHPHQADNLLVLQGVRYVDLYSMKVERLLSFEVGPDYIKQDGKIIFEGGCMLTWPTHVFHRIKSGPKGSSSINFATRSKDINMKRNFNIYNLNLDNGRFKVLRKGEDDQYGILD